MSDFQVGDIVQIRKSERPYSAIVLYYADENSPSEVLDGKIGIVSSLEYHPLGHVSELYVDIDGKVIGISPRLVEKLENV